LGADQRHRQYHRLEWKYLLPPSGAYGIDRCRTMSGQRLQDQVLPLC